MPNWTDITLECEGLRELPIFLEHEHGKPELDYNKIVPMPEYVRDTISPVRTNAVLCYLFTEYSEAEARDLVKKMNINADPELLSKAPEEIIALTNKSETLGYGDEAKEISAYDLGKNYVTAKETTGSWDWYDWAYDNWGVKWNASDSYLEGDKVYFMAPWGYPDKIFEKLALMFPEKDFYSEIIFEDEYDTIHTLDFSANHWNEGTEVNPGYIEETFNNLEFRLGLYNQRIAAYPEEMEESKAYGIAIQALEDGEPYATCTVNLPNLYGEFCEMIGIKNAAYMDTNNYPWVTQFLEQGIAVDTGFTKRSGFCEYPLYQFNEEWLKSLKPAVQNRTYDIYEKKYNHAMGIAEDEHEIKKEAKNMNVDFIKEKYSAGTRVILQNMKGEDQMPAGLKGTVTSVDDIGQIHVSWENGSSLAINPEVDSFAVDDSKELSIRPLTKQERDYTYTQEKHILEDAGCIGHLRVDMDTSGKGFYTDWSDHIHELNDSCFKKSFDHIINELRSNPAYDNILTDRESMSKYCHQHADEAKFGDDYHPIYGFRVDGEDYTCLLRLDPSPGNYAAYIYAYDKDSLDNHLEDMASREKMTVLEIAPGKEPKTVEIYSDLSSLQSEVGGLIECVYPWDDEVGIICNEEGKIMGLPLNRALRTDEGQIYDVIAGTMLIVGLTDDNFGSLTPEQIDVYSKMFKNPETIIHINGELKAFPSNDYVQIPVYLDSVEHAKENGELEAYRASFRANVDCKKEIEKSLAVHYSDNHLNSKAVYDEVTAFFGEDRVKMVLANTCNEKDWDARISRENKEWAKTIPVPDGKDSFGNNTNIYFICEKPHIGLVDLLCNQARRGSEKLKESKIVKESVLKKLDEKKAEVKPPQEKGSKGLEI